MSVPEHLRELSNVEYLWEIRKLAVRIGEIIDNKPQKHKVTYGDRVINLSLEVYEMALKGNEVYVNSEETYNLRRTLLSNAERALYSLSATVDVYLELCKNSPKCKPEKIIKEQQAIGEKIAYIINLVKAVKKSDRERFRKNKA